MRQALALGVGTVFKGVLLNYFRVVDVCATDSNKRRWKMSKWFEKIDPNHYTTNYMNNQEQHLQ